MTFSQLARLYGGVAYREEDRGDGAAVGTGGTDDEAAATAKAEKDAADKIVADKAAADKAEREKNITVPKARLDEAVGKERAKTEAAEKRAAEAEAKVQKAAGAADLKKAQAEIDDLEDQLEAKMAEGTPAERKALRAAIREKTNELARAEAKSLSFQATAQAVEQIRYDSVVDRVEADYPFLVEGAEDYNPEITESLLLMKKGGEAEGLSSSEALKRAVRALKPQLEAAKKAEKSGDEEAKAKAEKEAAEKAAADKAAAETPEAKARAEEAEKKRKEDATKKGLEAAKGQPAAKPGVAGTSDKGIKDLKVKDLSEDDFDKLPEAEKKRLRGD